VRKVANFSEVEEARTTFDRMHGPKDAIYSFLTDLPSAPFKSKKIRLNGS
jgi:hypothetical protein